MSSWATIESTIAQALEGLTQGGSGLLATVRGHSARDRRQVAAAIGRERLPAAFVVATGRDTGEKTVRRAGGATFSVFLATGSLRSDDEARVGSQEVTGIFALAEQVAAALQDLTVGGDRRVLLVDERPAGGEEGMIVWEQRYEVRREAAGAAPMFGGQVLAGVDSEVHVELGPVQQARSSFSFPGIDGVFQRSLGVRERAIVWRGQLRAAEDVALNAIESGIEDELRAGQARTMTDAWGRSFASCVLVSFERKGGRQRDELTGEAVQDFELAFTQLGG